MTELRNFNTDEYKYDIEKQYAPEVTDQNCYEYFLECYRRIKADVGEYGGFVFFNCEYTMSELIDEIEKLAAYLVSAGIKKGDVITAFLPTTPFAFTIFYAVNKIGAITSFVHPLTPPNGLAEILEVTKSKMVFMLDRAIGAYADVVKDLPTVVCSMSYYTRGPVKAFVEADDKKNSNVPDMPNITLYADAMAKDLAPVPTIEHNGEALALYLHGSGTTGKSKTVTISSAAMNHSTYWQNFCCSFEMQDVGHSYSLCALPCFHCFGISGAMHHCICAAMTPVIMPKFDARQANDYISKYKMEYIGGAPRMFEKMMAEDNFMNPGLKDLLFVHVGGDIVPEDLVVRFDNIMKEVGSRARMNRGWGLTELLGPTTTNTLHESKPLSIGNSIGMNRMKIMNENAEEVPNGEIGEICITSLAIMSGYLDDGVVKESGLHYDEEGRPWIYTGDMGYLDDDGYLYFTGRKKRIIIISGYNVYPYTMEQELNNLPYINEACAVQGYDDNKKPLVKLCISLKNTDMTEDEVKADVLDFCKKNFDQFSVPRKIIIMDELPRTKMDKLDFMALEDKIPE